MRIFNKQNRERHGSFCFPLSWVVCQVARVSYRTARVPNDMRALSLTRDFDTHTWVPDEREIKVTVTRVVFAIRQVCLKHRQNKVVYDHFAIQFLKIG